MKSIIINSSHSSTSSNSVFNYKFPAPIEFKQGDKIGLMSLTIPYSWGNINKQLYQNNSLQLIYNGVTTNLILDDGFYDVDALNAALANLIIKTDNNLPYYLNEQKEPIFFISFRLNTTTYSYELDSFPCKAPSAPTVYTNPKNSIYNGYCIQVKFNSNLASIVGLNKDKLYPSTSNYASNYAITSAMESLVPNANPVNCILIRCDLISNELSVPCDVLFSFNASSYTYGSNIYIQNQSLSLFSMKSGTFTNFNLSLWDQSFNMLRMLDNNICLQLVVERN